MYPRVKNSYPLNEYCSCLFYKQHNRVRMVKLVASYYKQTILKYIFEVMFSALLLQLD